MIARGNWYADYNDPATFLDCLATGNGNNDSGYSNPRYDDLLRRAKETADRGERAERLREAEILVVEEDVPILPLFHRSEPIAVQPRVQGLHANPRLWFPFRYVTVRP
jgi:oligopeptide transport system substrate-binding protein